MEWKELVDQPRVAALLRNSILNNRVAHAYLFAGSQGVGKSKLAIQFAKALLCERAEADPCHSCHHCLRVDTGNHPDLHRVAMDGASIKIDQIRQLQKALSFRASESARVVYMIEEVDKMTVQAANSLLKFLEEPEQLVTAILMTDHVQRVLPTVLSRCQIVYFDELPYEKRVATLTAEGLPEPLVRNACKITADLAEARELCQTDRFAQYRNLVVQLSEDILEKGSYVLVALQEKALKAEQGNEGLSLMLDLLLYWYRDILFFQIDRKDELVNIDQMEAIQRQAPRCGKSWIIKAMEVVMEAKERIGRHTNPQLSLERMVIQLQEG